MDAKGLLGVFGLILFSGEQQGLNNNTQQYNNIHLKSFGWGCSKS